jgi:hypothetical protein
MLAGIGLQLRPVNRYMPQFHQPRLFAQPQGLQEQSRQILQVRLTKAGDGIVIRVLVGGQVSEGYIFVRPALDFPRTHHPHTVAVQQQPHHHQRMVGGQSPAVFPVISGVNRRQVQSIDYVADESRQVSFRQPVLQGRRQQQRLVQIAHPEALAHVSRLTEKEPSTKHFLPEMIYSPSG